jgi:hypothetical protein
VVVAVALRELEEPEVLADLEVVEMLEHQIHQELLE